jgi:L-ascorbate metabolism protein UlaG (beta-lactamase superfamily)
MSRVRVTHVGGPTVLIEAEGWRILSDPTFDPPGRRYAFGWGTSSTKLSGPAIAAADLLPVDVALVSHDHHGDNLDDAGRALLPSAGVVVTTVPGAARLDVGARGLRVWESTRIEMPGRPALEIVATPCRHGPPLSRPIVGDVVGFALRWEGQEHGALWLSGDTVLTRDVRRIGERVDVGTAVVHLGRVQFPITGPVRYSMTAADAVELCGVLRPQTAIPVHYEGWSHFQEGRDEIERTLRAAPAPVRHHFRFVELGESLELTV